MEAAAQNVARYAAREAFKRIAAPFDGAVTARLTNVGDQVKQLPKEKQTLQFTESDYGVRR